MMEVASKSGETEASKSTTPNKTWRFIASKLSLKDLPCRRLYCEEGKKHDVALYYIRETYYAINATCPHKGGPLDTIIDIEQILKMDEPHAFCPWHLYYYNLRTGESPQNLKVETYDVKVEDENLYVSHQYELSLKPYSSKK